jgi:hypothetical protein
MHSNDDVVAVTPETEAYGFQTRIDDRSFFVKGVCLRVFACLTNRLTAATALDVDGTPNASLTALPPDQFSNLDDRLFVSPADTDWYLPAKARGYPALTMVACMQPVPNGTI